MVTKKEGYKPMVGVAIMTIVLVILALAAWRWGAESRPGFGETPTDRVEHWFPLSGD